MIELVLFLFLWTDSNALTLSDKQVVFTLYTVDKTWNEAQLVCEANNGTLFTQDSAERHAVLLHYKSSTDWTTNKDVWVGLHYPVGETGETFGWLSCESQNSSQFDAWKPNQPNPGNTKRCVSVDKNSHDWDPDLCSRVLEFLCETRQGDCTFTTLTNQQPKIDSSYTTVTSTEVNRNNCSNTCLTTTYDNKNCWAVNWIGASPSNNCLLHYTENPFYFTSSTLESAASRDFLIKQCYSFSSESTVPSVTTISSDDPVQGCSVFDVTPTTTATTTTSQTSTEVTSTSTITSQTTTSTPNTITQSTSPSTGTASQSSSTEATTSQSTSSASATTSQSSSSTTVSTSQATSLTSVTTSQATLSVSASTGSVSQSTSTTTGVISTTTSSIPANATAQNNCTCFCGGIASIRVVDPVYKNMSLNEKIQFLQLRLKLNVSDLSATVRKKTSAQDNRVESRAVGYVGIAFLCCVFVPIILSDALEMLKFVYEYLTKRQQIDTSSELK